MKQFVEDIHFDLDELKAIKASDLKVNLFCDGHLFVLLSKSQKPFLILKAGDVVTEEFIEKYFHSNILLLSVNTTLYISKLEDAWSNFKLSNNELERINNSKEILECSKEYFSEYSESILGVALVYFKHLYKFPRKHLLDQYESSSVLNQRSLIVAFFTTLLAINDNNNDYEFLRDLFTISFHLDSGLYKSGELTHYLLQASERERVAKNGRTYIEALEPKSYERFIKHPIESYRFLMKHSVFISNKKLIDLVRYQHEERNGLGFPFGVRHEVTNRVEEYISIADNIVPFMMSSFAAGDSAEYKFELESYCNSSNLKLAHSLHKEVA